MKNIREKLKDWQYAIENKYNAIPYTLVEMIVLFVVLCFILISTAEAKPHKRHVHKPTHVARTITNNNLSFLVTDVTTNSIVQGQNIDQIRALASITKLMTAMVALDSSTDMNKMLTLSKLTHSRMPVRQYSRGELFHMLLIKSDNAAAETLAADYEGGRSKFIRDMNIRAEMMGMYGTRFDDPSGLSNGNVSTASDVTTMVATAAQYYPIIRQISTKKEADILTHVKNKTHHTVIHNTNHVILNSVNGIQLSKTGFTNPAGFCVAILIEREINDETHHRIVVVMGARNPIQRADTVKRIINHV
jgi:D-alanyl-D-alanine endopeptidase (penicillin-binding protein 7)